MLADGFRIPEFPAHVPGDTLRYRGSCTNHNRMLSKEAFNQADSPARWTRELALSLRKLLVCKSVPPQPFCPFPKGTGGFQC
jgi:hypothetical protein